jgi:hypothetical protein
MFALLKLVLSFAVFDQFCFLITIRIHEVFPASSPAFDPLHEPERHRRLSKYWAREGALGDQPTRRALTALTKLLEVMP